MDTEGSVKTERSVDIHVVGLVDTRLSKNRMLSGHSGLSSRFYGGHVYTCTHMPTPPPHTPTHTHTHRNTNTRTHSKLQCSMKAQ